MKSRLQSSTSNVPPETIFILLLFVVTLILVSPKLLPSYQEINPHDETKYVESGRMIVDSQDIRELGRSPLVSLIYAVIYLFISQSLDWFMLSVGIGRVILFTLVWFGTIYLGLRFRESVHPYILIGVLFLSPAILVLLGNPSDAMFAAMSAFSLAKTIDFYRSKDLRDLAKASLFMGLAFASRPDGLFLSPVFIVIALAIGLRKVKFWKLLAATFLPGFIVVATFILLRFISTGDFYTGIGDKAYNSIGWGVSVTSDGDSISVGADEFGSREENRGNVLVAFSRYPHAVLQRVRGNARNAINAVIHAYGDKKIAPLLLLLATAGVISLLQRRSYALLIMLLIWPLPALLYLAFYIRAGFFLLSFFIPILLAAIGAAYIFSISRTRKERLIIVSVLIVFSLYSLMDSKPAFLAVGMISMMAFCLAWAIYRLYPSRKERETAGLFLAFCAGLLLHPSYVFPPSWSIGQSSQERAIHFLEENFKRGTGVASIVPLPVVAARMNHHYYSSVRLDDDPSQKLRIWVEETGIKVLFVEPVFIQAEPEIWKAIQENIGTLFVREFLADPGSIQIFVVQE